MLFEGRLPGAPIRFRAAWNDAWSRASAAPTCNDDLRHVAAQRLLKGGVTMGVASQILGHSPTSCRNDTAISKPAPCRKPALSVLGKFRRHHGCLREETPARSHHGALHGRFLHCKAVLEGREPSAAILGETAESHALVELAQHIRKLDETPRTLGEKLIGRHLVKMRAELTRRRQQQRIRHEGARRRVQPSPIEVWRLVARHAALRGPRAAPPPLSRAI